MKLDKLIKVSDLHDIWENEATSFTPWLTKEENLSILSETIGIEILFEERESSVGSFSVDIYAKEAGTGRNIIIENQLEDTDHDHLGKLITYASGKNAEIVIWIVKRARDEHRKAIEWLNNHTDESASFFLIEIELWKIGNSLPAPKFNVVEQPNEWGKAMRQSRNLSSSETLKLEYWTEFKNYAETQIDFFNQFSLRKPSKDHWYEFAVGRSDVALQLTITTPRNIKCCGIVINDNKALSKKFHDYIPYIENQLGVVVKWKPAQKRDRLIIEAPANLKNSVKWKEDFNWFISNLLKLKNIAHSITE